MAVAAPLNRPMKIKPLDKADLEMWMNENFTTYAFTPQAHIAGSKIDLRLEVNHFGICRVSMRSEILFEGQGYGQAIKIYNENL